MYKDTFGYFKSSELIRFLSGSDTERFKKVLEIGSYEGIFSCFAAENFAKFFDCTHVINVQGDEILVLPEIGRASCRERV